MATVGAMECESIETRSKRKGSPLSKDDAKKQSTADAADPVTPGHMRRQSSLPNIVLSNIITIKLIYYLLLTSLYSKQFFFFFFFCKFDISA